MYRVRDELLAHTGFALYQHIRRCLGDGFHAREHAAQGSAPAHEAAEVHRDADLLTQVVALSLEFFFQARILGQRAT